MASASPSIEWLPTPSPSTVEVTSSPSIIYLGSYPSPSIPISEDNPASVIFAKQDETLQRASEHLQHCSNLLQDISKWCRRYVITVPYPEDSQLPPPSPPVSDDDFLPDDPKHEENEDQLCDEDLEEDAKPQEKDVCDGSL